MPVIINEFEIEPTQPSDNNSSEVNGDQTQSQPPQLSPIDIKVIMDRQQQRWLRLHAH